MYASGDVWIGLDEQSGNARRRAKVAVAGQGDEGDVFAAGPLDVAAADDALRTGEQANSTTFNSIAGGYAVAPVTSLLNFASKQDRSI